MRKTALAMGLGALLLLRETARALGDGVTAALRLTVARFWPSVAMCGLWGLIVHWRSWFEALDLGVRYGLGLRVTGQ